MKMFVLALQIVCGLGVLFHPAHSAVLPDSVDGRQLTGMELSAAQAVIDSIAKHGKNTLVYKCKVICHLMTNIVIF